MRAAHEKCSKSKNGDLCKASLSATTALFSEFEEEWIAKSSLCAELDTDKLPNDRQGENNGFTNAGGMENLLLLRKFQPQVPGMTVRRTATIYLEHLLV